jgi:hypothetical protein
VCVEERHPDTDARAGLAAQQARLVAALTASAPPPEGFDAARVTATAAALRSRRRRSVARAWPALVTAVGAPFRELFDAYAHASPCPTGGPAADALAFVEHLARSGRLPQAARVELLVSRCRRGFPVRAAVLRDPRRLLLVVRLPWRGVRRWIIPLGRRSAGRKTNPPFASARV